MCLFSGTERRNGGTKFELHGEAVSGGEQAKAINEQDARAEAEEDKARRPEKGVSSAQSLSVVYVRASRGSKEEGEEGTQGALSPNWAEQDSQG